MVMRCHGSCAYMIGTLKYIDVYFYYETKITFFIMCAAAVYRLQWGIHLSLCLS